MEALVDYSLITTPSLVYHRFYPLRKLEKLLLVEAVELIKVESDDPENSPLSGA